MINTIPKEVVDILEIINKQYYEGFIVGGAVRDLLLNKSPKDYDICTDMPLEKIKELIPHFHIMKRTKTRNAGIIVVNNTPIEISTYKGDTLKEDILKRDFTVNGIALSHTDGLIDYYNFRKDISDKKIRLIDKSNKSIEENPLIILRAIKFSKKLNFEIESETKKRIIESSELLKTVKQERITKELYSLLIVDKFNETFTEYKTIFDTIMPELSALNEIKLQKTEELLKVLHNNHILRLAAMFMYIDNNIEKFKQVALRLNFDKKTTKSVIALLKYSKKDLKTDKKSILRLIHEINIQNVALLFAFKYAYLLIENKDTKELSGAQALYQNEIDEITKSKLSNLTINKAKIEEMGYTTSDSVVIYENVKGKVINSELPTNEKSLKQYILKHYKRS